MGTSEVRVLGQASSRLLRWALGAEFTLPCPQSAGSHMDGSMQLGLRLGSVWGPLPCGGQLQLELSL